MSIENNSETSRHLRVAIIGAGFSGLGMAIKMLGSGEDNFLIFERAGDLGGTWRQNTYPGVECDIYADLYSYSFAPNLKWSKTYGTRDELMKYLKDCSTKSGVSPHLRFNHELLSAEWNSEKQHWELETSGGKYTTNVLISGMGYLSEPRMPDIQGLEDFDGVSLHSAEWDHSVDLEGKRIAVIGTGASAIQIIPVVQPQVEHLDVYQRTPGWFMAKHDKPNTGLKAWAIKNIPGVNWLKRTYHMLTAEMVVWQLVRPARTYFMRKIGEKHLKASVSDPELRKKLTPDYAIGCKRIMFSDTYFPAIQQPNVELVCDPINRIEKNGVVTSDGKLREVDILVLATGFEATSLPFAKRIVGATGERLADTWRDGQYSYLGATVAGYPNFFMLLGPNTTIGHTSITLMMEAQIQYVSDALAVMKERDLSMVDVKPEVISSYNQNLQASLAPTVWNAGGCTSSGYKTKDGMNTTIWPFTTLRFRKLTRRFDIESYITAGT